jgi:hypothetical protein
VAEREESDLLHALMQPTARVGLLATPISALLDLASPESS